MIEELKKVGKHKVAETYWLDKDTICIMFQDEYPSKYPEEPFYFNIWGEYHLDVPEFMFGVNYYEEGTDDFLESITDLPEETRYNMPPLDDEERLTEEEKQIVIDYLKRFAEEG